MKNFRLRNGSLEVRRFAYRVKGKPGKSGLLEAMGYQDARSHLSRIHGRGVEVQVVWVLADVVAWLERRSESLSAFAHGVLNAKRVGK